MSSAAEHLMSATFLGSATTMFQAGRPPPRRGDLSGSPAINSRGRMGGAVGLHGVVARLLRPRATRQRSRSAPTARARVGERHHRKTRAFRSTCLRRPGAELRPFDHCAGVRQGEPAGKRSTRGDSYSGSKTEKRYSVAPTLWRRKETTRGRRSTRPSSMRGGRYREHHI